jgi:hypothetical protein
MDPPVAGWAVAANADIKFPPTVIADARTRCWQNWRLVVSIAMDCMYAGAQHISTIEIKNLWEEPKT